MVNTQRESYEQPEEQNPDKDRDKKALEKRVNSVNQQNLDLTPAETQKLERQETSIPELVEERLQLKAQAEDELARLMRVQHDNEPVLTREERLAYEDKLEHTTGPGKTRELLEEIKNIPRNKAKEKEQAKQNEKDEKRLNPEHPDILKHKGNFNKICDDNKDLIGTGEVEGFKAWFAQEIWRNPTGKNAKDMIRRLEGKSVYDTGGLAPRREEFGKLEKLFQAHKVSGGPLESNYIKKEGLKERATFRKNAEELEGVLEKQKELGFCSEDMIEKSMKKILLADNPTAQSELLNKAKSIARQEAEGFTHLDKSILVGGKNIRAMSASSKKKYLDYYKNTEFQEREGLVGKWPTLVHNEAKLAYELRDIYGEDTENLKIAVESFEELDYLEKQAALKDHQNLVRNNKDKVEKSGHLIRLAASAKLHTAAKNKDISARTEENYGKLFKDPNNFKNTHTGKPGDLDEMQKAYDILKNPIADEGHKNLAAYKARRKDFTKDLNELKLANPDLDEKEIKEWEKKYDEEGWKKRERIHDDLKLELKKAEKLSKENKEKEVLEEKVGLEKKQKDEILKENLTLDEVRTRVFEFFADKQPGEAMKVLVAYNEQDPDNPEILILMKTALEYMEKFGSGKKVEQTIDRQLDQEMDNLLATDKSLQKQMLEAQIETKMIEGARQSEHLYDHAVKSRERAQQESLDQVEDDSLEENLIESAYAQMGEDFILDEEGRGEQIKKVEFSKTEYTDTELQKLRRTTRQEQDRLDHNEGFSEFQLVDKNQKAISAKQAEATEKETDRKDLETELAEKAEEKIMAKTSKTETGGAEVFDLQTAMAARRRSKEKIDQKRFSKIAA